ncbi:MAG: glycosyltransferase family 2 protein [Proteobacteria bacterium]|nr:glycosyltransferase family 2 protein [Pseudomonadota bacterium]
MSNPTLSVIICTWNRAELLGQTLATLAAQSGVDPESIEVLVVDNNSSDDTPTVVRNAAAGWPLGRLRYVAEPRQGKQFALNRGIETAVADLLVFTDDDVIAPRDWLAQILAAFRDPTVELLGGKTLVAWPDGKPPAWYHRRMLAVVAGVDIGDERLRPPPADYAPSGSNVAVRRRVFERIGGYSETHFRHMDYEFGQRALARGVIVEYNPLVVVSTEAPRHTINKRYFRRWYFKLGIARAMKATPPQVPYLLGVPRWMWGQVLANGGRWLSTALRQSRNAAFVYELAVIDFAGQLSAVWHRRLRPGHHDRWVARWSQKPGGTFS